MGNKREDYYDDSEDLSDDIVLHQSCPNCGREYDEIDYEYQICSLCKHEVKNE